MNKLNQIANPLNSPALVDVKYVPAKNYNSTDEDLTSLINGINNEDLTALIATLQSGSAKICKGGKDNPCKESTVYEVTKEARAALNNLYEKIKES